MCSQSFTLEEYLLLSQANKVFCLIKAIFHTSPPSERGQTWFENEAQIVKWTRQFSDHQTHKRAGRKEKKKQLLSCKKKNQKKKNPTLSGSWINKQEKGNWFQDIRRVLDNQLSWFCFERSAVRELHLREKVQHGLVLFLNWLNYLQWWSGVHDYVLRKERLWTPFCWNDRFFY